MFLWQKMFGAKSASDSILDDTVGTAEYGTPRPSAEPLVTMRHLGWRTIRKIHGADEGEGGKRLIHRFGRKGHGKAQLNMPCGVAVSSSGKRQRHTIIFLQYYVRGTHVWYIIITAIAILIF